jgi:hypothetical protein
MRSNTQHGNIRCGSVGIIGSLAAVAVLLGACAGSAEKPQQDAGATAAQPAQAIGGLLPAPATLPQSTGPAAPKGSSATEILLSGNSADNLLPHNLYFLSMSNTRGSFNPSSAPGGPLSGYAYAIFSIDINGYTGPQELHLGWVQPGPPADRGWIGLANYVHNIWEWTAMPADGVLPVDTLSGDYDNAAGVMRVAIVTAGPANWLLDSIGLTGNTPPVAAFATPDIRSNINDIVTLDASKSWDPDGSIVNYEFDAEGDGTFFDKNLTPNITHKYTQGGEILVAVRVTDNEGAVAEAELKVTTSWLSSIMGSAGENLCTAMTLHTDGDLICVGGLQDLGTGGVEAFIAKYDRFSGAPAWEKTYGGLGDDRLCSVAVNSLGYIYAAGIQNGSDSGTGVLLKLDSDGNLEWHYEWDMACSGTPLVRVDGAERLYFASELPNGPGGPSTVFVAQLNAAAEIQWQREYEHSDDIFLNAICFDMVNNVYLAGSGYGFSADPKDGLLVSLDTAGGLRFDKYFDAGLEEEFTAICFDGSNLYLGGLQLDGGAGDSLLCSADLLGGLHWVETYSTSPSYEGVYGGAWPLPSGGCIMSGVARDAAGNLEALLLSIDQLGGLQWQTGLGVNAKNDQGYCCAADGLGRVFLGGVLEQEDGVGFTELNGSLTPIPSPSLLDASGATVNNSRALGPGSATLSDLSGETRGSGGAFIAQYFAPLIL